MKKMTFANNLTYIFDAKRAGAKYTLDGEHWMNHGEYCECLAKSVLGYEPTKDANTAFNAGEDIPELNASVKSWNAGLTDMKLGATRAEYVEKFFSMSNPETVYLWVYDYADMVDLWFMDATEFRAFVEAVGNWDEHCKKIRFKTCNNKINLWLESML